MGNKDFQFCKNEEKITKNLFDFKYVIGKGGFGKVWKVSYKKTKYYYALKEMSKVKIIDKKSERSIMSERFLLSKLRHPFIVNMICAFQDKNYLYLVMDLLLGGDLRYHLCRCRNFSEKQTKFFIACIILALEYIHSNKIIHRDIKPENLVCEKDGYVRVTDFGVAKYYHKNNSNETSGTPGYMSPEVLLAKNHSYPADYFAVGVIGFEFLMGFRPYLGDNRKEIKEAVLAKQVQININKIPKGWSKDAIDFINKLLQRKVHERLGYNSIEEIKSHSWFNGFDWEGLYNKKMESPFTPRKGDNFDRDYCESIEKIGETTVERYRIYKGHECYKDAFLNYTINNIPDEEIQKMKKLTVSSISTNSSIKKSNNNNNNYNNSISKDNQISSNLRNINNLNIEKDCKNSPEKDANKNNKKIEVKYTLKSLKNICNQFHINKNNKKINNKNIINSNNINEYNFLQIKNFNEKILKSRNNYSNLNTCYSGSNTKINKLNNYKQVSLNKYGSCINLLSPLHNKNMKTNFQKINNIFKNKKLVKSMKKTPSILNINLITDRLDKKESLFISKFQKISLNNFRLLSPQNINVKLFSLNQNSKSKKNIRSNSRTCSKLKQNNDNDISKKLIKCKSSLKMLKRNKMPNS